jgi:hypothetical protein
MYILLYRGCESVEGKSTEAWGAGTEGQGWGQQVKEASNSEVLAFNPWVCAVKTICGEGQIHCGLMSL